MGFKKNKLTRFMAMGAMAVMLAACDTPEEKAASYIENGNEYYKEGKYVKALIEYKNALQIDNKLVAAWVGIANVEEKREKWDQVTGAYKRTLDLDPDNFDANFKLGRLMLLGGVFDQALTRSTKALELKPDHPGAMALQAAVLFKIGDSEGAVKYAKAALEKEPNNLEALIVMAAERLLSGNGEEAIAYLDQGIAANKENLGLKLIKIQALSKLKKLDEAEAIFIKMLELNPDDVGLRGALANFYLQANRLKDAERELKAIAAKNPDDVKANMQVVRFINDTAGSPAAMEELKKLIQTRKNNFPYQMALVNLNYGADNRDEAFKMLEDMILTVQDVDNKLNAKLRMAELLISSGDDKRAMEIVDEVIATDSRNVRALAVRGAYKIRQGELDGAIEDLRTILKDDPGSTRALMLLGNAHEQKKALDLADDRYGMAFRMSNFSANIGTYYTQFLMRRGSIKRAEATLLKVIENNRTNADTLRQLADIRLQLGDWNGAQEIVNLMKKSGFEEQITLQLQGQIYAGRDMLDQSIESFKAVHAATPEALQPLVSLVRTYIQAGQTDKAEEFIDTVLIANDKNFFAHLLKARLSFMRGDKAGAEASYNAAINAESDNPVGYANLATFQLVEKRTDDALVTIEKGLGVQNDNMNLRLLKANALQIQKKYEEAIAAYEEMLELDPNSVTASNNLASLLVDYRDDPASLDRAYELTKNFEKSNVPFFRDTLAMVYLKKGDVLKAIDMLKDVEKQAPALAIVKYHLAQAYVAQGNKVAAKNTLNEALSITDDRTFEDRDKAQKLLDELNQG